MLAWRGVAWSSLLLMSELARAQAPSVAPVSAPPAAKAPPTASDADVSAARETAPTTDLEPRAAYDQARTLYLSGQFEQCSRAFSALLSPDQPRPLSDVHIIERARIYYAACLMGLGRDADGQEQMRSAIRANPRMLPPNPLIFPAPVVSSFAAMQSALLEEIQASEDARVREAQEQTRIARQRAAQEIERVEVLEGLAAQESVVVQNRRWMAFIPFGVGQFQNGDDLLGWILLSTEAVLAGATITATSLELAFHSQASRTNVDPEQFNERVAAAGRVQDTGLIGFAVLAVAGVVEAQVSFVSERRLGVRPRALPRSLARFNREPGRDRVFNLTPRLALLPGSIPSLSVSAAF